VSDTQLNSHIADDYSPLEILILQALRRYGEFSPSTMDGDVGLMFIEFANMVVDEVRNHPYHTGERIRYYTALTDIRTVPDPIMVNGMLLHYAVQQGSQKVQLYAPNYFRQLNQHLWFKLNGNTKIRMRVVDNGTHPTSEDGSTNPINGLTTNE
jgi:hypothetical protein